MGVITDRNEAMENIYTAYGYTVYARSAVYHWTAGVTNKTEDNIYTEIDIKDPTKKTVFQYVGYNRFIFADILEKNIDCLLWWIKTDSPNTYDIEKTFEKAVLENSCLFSYKINQRKEEKRKRNEARSRNTTRDKQKEEIKNAVINKGYYLLEMYGGEDGYVIQILDPTINEYLNNADTEHKERIIHFMTEYPDNKQATILCHYDLLHDDPETILYAIQHLI